VNRTAARRIAPVARLVRALAGAACLLAAAVPPAGALTDARDVPLPRLSPVVGRGAAKPAALPSPAATLDATANAVRTPPVAFNPALPFTAQQQAALAGINAYLNSFLLMEGKFIQISPDGRQAEGVFFINRPGRVRFHYNPPSQLDITANNGTVAVRDRRLNTQDLYPLSKTPLRYLLADRIDLFQPGLVDSMSLDNDQISIVIVEKSNLVTGQIRMTFDRRTYQLLRWVVTDAAGDTSFGVYDTTVGKPQDPALFRIAVN
jgi:outer membrane lipoprotein-sorting protein